MEPEVSSSKVPDCCWLGTVLKWQGLMTTVSGPFQHHLFLDSMIKVVILFGKDSLIISISYMRQGCASEVTDAERAEN